MARMKGPQGGFERIPAVDVSVHEVFCDAAVLYPLLGECIDQREMAIRSYCDVSVIQRSRFRMVEYAFQ